MPAFIIPGRVAKGLRPTSPFTLNHELAQDLGLVSFVPLTPWSAHCDLSQQRAITTPEGGPVARGIPNFTSGYVFATGVSGDQSIDLGNPSALQITGPLSIFAYYALHVSVPANNAGYQVVAKDKDTGGRAYTFDVFTATMASAGVRFYINGGGAGDIVVEGRVPVIGDNRFAVVTYQPSVNLKIYINGLLTATSGGTASAAIQSATSNARIGRRDYSGFTEPFKGVLGHVGICNKTLTANQVWHLSDPATRWDLYWVPGRRLYFDQGAAPATGRAYTYILN